MLDELDEIWALYADDGAQALQAAEEALIQLKANPADQPNIAALFRSLHTFKGNSRLLGLSVIESRAHVAEDVIGLVRDGNAPLDEEMLDLLLETTDALRGMMDAAIVSRADSDEAPTAALIARLTEKFERCQSGSGELPRQDVESARDQQALPASGFESPPLPDVPTRTARLGDDPLYFEIFLELVWQTLNDVEPALSPQENAEADPQLTAQEAAMRLRESAERIDLDEWVRLACEIGDAVSDTGRLEQALARLRDMHMEGSRRLNHSSRPDEAPGAADAGEGSTATQGKAHSFLAIVSPFLETLAHIGSRTFQPTPELFEATLKLTEAARSAGYQRLAEAGEQIAEAQDTERFDAALFELYQVITLLGHGGEMSPALREPAATPLAVWCASKTGETLGKLALAINGRPARELDWDEIGVLARNLWCIFHARNLETACYVTGALQDLVARVRSGEMPPDPPLLRILFSFVEAGKPLLLKGTPAGGEAAAEDLLQRTGDALSRFCAREDNPVLRSLQLDPAFVDVLSRESVASIEKALSDGRNLFVVRADTESFPEAATAFIEWLSSEAQSLASVTVFADDSTRFDFLIATPLDEPSVLAALSAMDPSGNALAFRGAVPFESGQLNKSAASSLGADVPIAEPHRASASILESVGEILTAHATLRSLLVRSSDDDRLRSIERLLVAKESRREDVQLAVETVRSFRDNIEQLLALEEQIAGNLEHLQREFVASRLVSSEALLAGLERAARDVAADAGVHLRLGVSGKDEWIDSDILKQLDASSTALIECAAEEMSAHRGGRLAREWMMDIELRQSDKRVSLCLTSRFDGCVAERPDVSVGHTMERAVRALQTRGGEFLRVVSPGNEGVTYTINAPQSTVMLDGMIVRVGAIHYVVPVQSVERIVHLPSAAIRQMSADNGRSILRIDHNTMAPIIHLSTEARCEKSTAAHHARDNIDGDERLFVIASADGRLAALPVDELLGQQPLLVRPLTGYLSGLASINGCAPLGDGGVGMVVNPSALFDPRRATFASVGMASRANA